MTETVGLGVLMCFFNAPPSTVAVLFALEILGLIVVFNFEIQVKLKYKKIVK